MTFYLFLVAAVLGVAAWLYFKEGQAEKKNNTSSLLDRIGLGETHEATPAPSNLSSFQKSEPAARDFEEPVRKEEVSTLRELSLPQSGDPDLKDRYDRLEKLFQEKSTQLEKVEKSLSHELKAKTEFHKLKDILEKELKDTKDKNHKLQLQISTHQTETESIQKHIQLLEEKIKAKDQDILAKEQKIEELFKKQQSVPAAQPVAQKPEAPKEAPKPPEPVAQKPETPKEDSRPSELIAPLAQEPPPAAPPEMKPQEPKPNSEKPQDGQPPQPLQQP